MLFDIDKQTIRDLNLFGERTTEKSIFSFYNRAVTKGGNEMLNKLFRNPVADFELLQCRKEEINFFFQHVSALKLTSRAVEFIEHYLSNDRVPLRNNIIDATFNGIKNKISADGDYWIISTGILHAIRLLIDLKSLIKETASFEIPLTLQEDLNRIKAFIASEPIKSNLFYPPEDIKDLSFAQISGIDHLIRCVKKNEFRELMNIVYKFDVLQTLSGLMKTNGFTLPEYNRQSQPLFEVTDGYYPILSAPIPNSFNFDHNSNLCFITGPNMAGKSTFLKTMGIMIYLSHLGFPVPARQLKTTIFDGLFTTINLADNLNLGYSHFYSEVKRVKDIVVKINTEQHLFVIFDELFRGTNVKDAYDASLKIISSLARIRNNFFFVSTHILEVAENLDHQSLIQFKCFESELVNQSPVYDFKLKDGVSKERIGMTIINRENIIGILDQIIEKQKQEQIQ